jgi:hypothetical protein
LTSDFNSLFSLAWQLETSKWYCNMFMICFWTSSCEIGLTSSLAALYRHVSKPDHIHINIKD